MQIIYAILVFCQVWPKLEQRALGLVLVLAMVTWDWDQPTS